MTSSERDLFAALKHFSDPGLCRDLLRKLENLLRESGNSLRFMEVCGTHTVSIFRSGLRSLLPAALTHISGPGCPVCVTHDREIAACLSLAGMSGVRLATFGDLLRVPGPDGQSLKDAQARGARADVLYSPLEALSLARANPRDKVVFLGVGFETTAPAVAVALQKALELDLRNFFVLSMHKLVPPALRALLEEKESPEKAAPGSASLSIDAFILPGHVSTILGLEPYAFIADEFGKPAVVSGFSPADILQSLLLLLERKIAGKAEILNQYRLAVSARGNPRARKILLEVFTIRDALWRGLGRIPGSGLVPGEAYARFDAWKVFDPALPEARENTGCRCGLVLRGRIEPPECPLFGRACTPAHPAGPCMVSTEGGCAAHYKYNPRLSHV
ncbi:MAG: hydrogenase formation protein HypD [Deltaproteobacteria bacterium]|jgi:hydrogenase expression/formation protein HypD|nr:hydrogenase formation protein HypD [Deltaproteobacteria bacterium]